MFLHLKPANAAVSHQCLPTSNERRLHSQAISFRYQGGANDGAEVKRLHLPDLESCGTLLPNPLEILAYAWRI